MCLKHIEVWLGASGDPLQSLGSIANQRVRGYSDFSVLETHWSHGLGSFWGAIGNVKNKEGKKLLVHHSYSIDSET
jgi:hypothetical protein